MHLYLSVYEESPNEYHLLVVITDYQIMILSTVSFSFSLQPFITVGIRFYT